MMINACIERNCFLLWDVVRFADPKEEGAIVIKMIYELQSL